jgi:hypothetical protein
MPAPDHARCRRKISGGLKPHDSPGQDHSAHCRGINAKKTIFAQFEGSFTDSRHLVDYSERRRYCELACKLMGLLKEVQQIGVEPAPIFNMTVRFTESDGNGREKELPDLLEGEVEETPSDAASPEETTTRKE